MLHEFIHEVYHIFWVHAELTGATVVGLVRLVDHAPATCVVVDGSAILADFA